MFGSNISQRRRAECSTVVCPGSLVSLPLGPPAVLTPGEEDGVELEAAAVLQPAGQLAEEAAVQVEGDFQGLPTALHLVAHWSVCTYGERKRDRKQVNQEQNQALGKKCPHHLRETNRNKPLIVLLFTQRDLRGAELLCNRLCNRRA